MSAPLNKCSLSSQNGKKQLHFTCNWHISCEFVANSSFSSHLPYPFFVFDLKSFLTSHLWHYKSRIRSIHWSAQWLNMTTNYLGLRGKHSQSSTKVLHLQTLHLVLCCHVDVKTIKATAIPRIHWNMTSKCLLGMEKSVRGGEQERTYLYYQYC